FHGDAAHVYRLNLTTTPLLKQVFPAGALAGSEAIFELLTFPRSPEPLIRNVQVPADAKSIYWHYDEALDGNFPIVVERAPGHTEHEPNDALGAAQPIAIDTIVSGRMHRVGDIDGYRLAVRQGVRYEIQCRPRPAGLATLPVL